MFWLWDEEEEEKEQQGELGRLMICGRHVSCFLLNVKEEKKEEKEEKEEGECG